MQNEDIFFNLPPDKGCSSEQLVNLSFVTSIREGIQSQFDDIVSVYTSASELNENERLQRKVLIVDDCLEDREVYTRYLLRTGEFDYIFIEAELGKEGLELCQQQKPDVVLLDYLLPDIDGIEFLSELRKLKRVVSIPVIVLTGQGNEEVAVQAMKLGAADYLIKGEISADKLKSSVNYAIEKAQLRRQLQQSEERLRLALDAVHMGTWEWNIQTNAMLCSEHVAPMFGLAVGESLPNYQVFLDTIHPNDLELVTNALNNAIASGEKQDVEFRVVWADGSERWLQVAGKLYRNTIGQLRCIVGTVVDITQRKQAELEQQQLMERERITTQIAKAIRQSLNLDEILNTAVQEVREFLQTDRVLLFRLLGDGSGTVVTESVGIGTLSILSTTIHDSCFNQKYTEAYRRGLVTAKTDIYTDNIEPCHLELLSQFQVRANLVVPILRGEQLWGLLIAHHCLAPREWQQIEIDLLTQLATQIGIAIQQAELYEQAQVEIIERQRLLESEKAARAEAERANRIKDEFLAVLSHELRSPLNPILGWANLLQSGRLDAVKIDQAATIIARNAKLQVDLIEDLLDVSRILRGKLTLNPSSVNLASIVAAALETVRLSAEVKAIQIHTTFEPLSKQVFGDAARLQQVVWNLLSNAVKFTPASGQVDVRLEEINGMAQICVCDTGKGIKQEFLPFIFDYFRQEDSSTTRNFGGLGLGLAIVRHLVELHGGTVCAESAGEGQGATFTVSLPLIASQESDISNDEVRNDSSDLDGVNVLVVDDEVDSRDLIAFLLEQAGATVVSVSSAAQALDMLRQFQADILVSDIGMPQMDGYILIRNIRNLPPEQGGTIPAIALTAYAGEYDKQQALDAGFQQHLSKPIETDNLIQAIKSLLRLVSAT